MAAWFAANWGSILICIILAVIVAAIIRKMVRDKKAGKCSCGGNCKQCGGGCTACKSPCYKTE